MKARKSTEGQLPKAEYNGALNLGGLKVVCAVLGDKKTRVISERSLAYALGARGGAAHWSKRRGEKKGALLPEYISRKTLIPFISDELRSQLMNPVLYEPKSGGVARGLEATRMPDICDVWIRAREKGALTPRQEDMAERAYILLRGFAHIGIIALVDEATGFEADRAKDALAKILQEFISTELCKWVKTFPDDYYEQLFRLRGLSYDQFSTKRPRIIGKITKDIVYQRVAPGVLDALLERTSRRKDGRLKNHLHRWLTPEVGQQKLREHLAGTIALMTISPNYRKFHAMLNRVYPRQDLPPEFPGMDSVPYDAELDVE